MSEQVVSAQTRKFYEQYQFPGNRPLDHDGLVLLRHLDRAIASIHAESGSGPIRILDSGCGTGNTSIALARHFGSAKILGIDQSQTSLRQARAAALHGALRNAKFRRWNLVDPLLKLGPFDIVLCLGVLHHTANMKKVLVNLRKVMKSNGILFLWIYGKLGRHRHTLNVRALRYLTKNTSDQETMTLATEYVRHAATRSTLSDLLGKTPVDEMQRKAFEDPVWIADQFLHPHEELLDMEGLLALVKSAGLTLDQNLGGLIDVPTLLDSPMLLERYRKLNEKEQCIVLDLILKPDRYFVTLRPRQ